jgi:hypothetical protein
VGASLLFSWLKKNGVLFYQKSLSGRAGDSMSNLAVLMTSF